MNFRRIEKGVQESSYWHFPNSQASSPKHYGVLTGLDLASVKVSQKPAYETYVSGSSDLRESHNELSTGLDVSMRLSSKMISAFTINPDFGQVEADPDPDTIELRDTERFLREKRTFFREGSELFDTPLNIYYSRRFTDIDAGAKITGQGKQWAMGLVDVQGEIMRDDIARKGNYNVGESSHVGGMWADSRRDDGSNTTGGFDSRIYLDETTSFTTQFLGLRDSNGIETDGAMDNDAYGFYTSLNGGT